MKRKTIEVDKTIVILSITALILNLLVFIPLFKEQLKTGFGFGTNFEMLVLVFWMVQFASLPFIIYSVIHILYRLIIRKTNHILFINIGVTLLTTLIFVLSIYFVFN